MDPQIFSLRESTSYFADILATSGASDRPDVERIIDGYIDHKRTAAVEMQRLATRQLGLDEDALDRWKEQVEARMSSVLPEAHRVLPAAYFVVRGYSGIHRTIFAYLDRHSGRPVSALRLRVLTADQVHTERRVRELRDLGLRVESTRESGTDVYNYLPAASSIEDGARYQLRRNLREVNAASPALRKRLESELDAGC
jgi:hypothetical protein